MLLFPSCKNLWTLMNLFLDDGNLMHIVSSLDIGSVQLELLPLICKEIGEGDGVGQTYVIFVSIGGSNASLPVCPSVCLLFLKVLVCLSRQHMFSLEFSCSFFQKLTRSLLLFEVYYSFLEKGISKLHMNDLDCERKSLLTAQ